MALTVAELSEHVVRLNDRLATVLEKLGKEFADFRVEVSAKLSAINTSLAFVKWIGTALAGVALGAFATTATVAYQAGAQSKTIVFLEKAVLESQPEAKTRDAQLAEIMAALRNLQQ